MNSLESLLQLLFPVPLLAILTVTLQSLVIVGITVLLKISQEMTKSTAFVRLSVLSF
jgi:hypothetical protein